MTVFMRLLTDEDKAESLLTSCRIYRSGNDSEKIFQVNPIDFKQIPGSPLAYWAGQAVINLFSNYPTLEGDGRIGRQGIATADDFRFVRTWWETINHKEWFGFAKGGKYSPFYADIHLIVKWVNDGAEIKNFADLSTGKIRSRPQSTEYYFRPGITWSLVTTLKLSGRILPSGCIISVIGPGFFVANDELNKILAITAILNSKAYIYLLEMQLGLAAEGRRAYQVGTINRVPFPAKAVEENELKLAAIAKKYWSIKRDMDSIDECSHAFLLPEALRKKHHKPHLEIMEAELKQLQWKIDEVAFDIYGFGEKERAAIESIKVKLSESRAPQEDDFDEDDATSIDQTDGILSWATGVAFGRFNWSMATGEVPAPPEPEPFDPLPAKSPGMLPDYAEPFHAHSGILVDDQGHPHDLTRLVEEVLTKVDVSVPDDVRRWLCKDFFAFHLQRYSKSRRKAPIYWPLSTASGSYTLWIYYPSLNNQTFFKAVNDFLDGPNGKLTQVSRDCAELRIKGSVRSRDEEKHYEELQFFEQELTDLRDTLLNVAPTYQPNHDDGVQISAAPLWQLFRHKPWQKVLKDTWTKLEKGDYDWAHLAMAYWPERVREKCKTDKSLAIAHGLEDFYVEPEAAPKKTREKKKAGANE